MSFNIGNLTITVAGESHSSGLTVILEGIKPGMEIDMDEIYSFMQRRAPGKNRFSTPRKEADLPEILSGVKNGFSTGSAIAAVIRNTNTKSKDYGDELDVPRPGHADYPASIKFGKYFDFCGGGQFSGRITATLCFAGGIAKCILKKHGINVLAHISEIHGIEDKSYKDTVVDVSNKDFPVIDDESGIKMMDEIDKARENLDSVGGKIECIVEGIPAGIGDSLFGGLDGELAKAIFGIPAVKGIEFGAGFDVCEMFGSENNDEYYMDDGAVKTKTNNHGGILGGITTGMPLIFNTAFKPTPSIAKEQNSVSLKEGSDTKLSVHGRHDPCIVQRAVPVVEAVTALVILGKLGGI